MKRRLICPHCGRPVEAYRNPFPTVDVIIETDPVGTPPGGSRGPLGIVLIQRKNPPFGWALPGGFVNYGESLEAAAVREAEEETSLKVDLCRQLGAYSDPLRDPRFHTITVVFVARAAGEPRAADDAAEVGVFHRDTLPDPLAFDHGRILRDYFKKCEPAD
jgi:ADP-ribose pyrophosphatase YjhB (NUDIX family)